MSVATHLGLDEPDSDVLALAGGWRVVKTYR